MSLISSPGCTSETTPVVYIGMDYQVRCLDCEPRVPDDSKREINAVNGEAGYKLTCTVTKSGGTRRVSFAAEHRNSSDSARNYTLSVKNGRLGADESDGPCEVRLIEGDNTYVGGCSTDEPSADRPCQVNFELKGDVIKGGIFCDKISNESNQTLRRYLVAPYTRSDPAQFELYGCHGL